MSLFEGRALAARPSLCVLAVLVAGALLVSTASAAETPSLSGTNPKSPGASLTPRVLGDADGIIISVAPLALGGPMAREVEPGTEITIYTDEDCTGPVAAIGTPEDLEGAGILIEGGVPPDSETTFYATATDLAGTSECSNGTVYQQVSTPPGPPTLTGVTPASGSNQNFPSLTGSAAPGSTVLIFTDPNCTGIPIASGTAAAFSAGGIQVQVGDNTTTTFYAAVTTAGFTSPCSSSSVTYQEVTPPGGSAEGGGGPVSNGPGVKPPAPRLRTVPAAISSDRTPTVTGTAAQAVLVRLYGGEGCQGAALAKVPVAQFLAGVSLEVVPNTTVAFSARSVDSDGDESGCSTPVLYTNDSIAPRTRFTSGPAAKTHKKIVVFRFADTTGGADTKFLCKVDRRKWKPCQTPLRLKRLGHRRHLLQVKAYDAAGNHEKRAVKRRFQVVRAD